MRTRITERLGINIEGDIDAGYLYCGQVAGMVHEVLSVKEVIDAIVQGAVFLSKRLRELEA
ncbi:MAG: hypothetical protein HYX94_13560 [Chloroflexi bacterium]|nr:hypothetical protein [Chloroflexota bacterium]